jgi:hypothetical protein
MRTILVISFIFTNAASAIADTVVELTADEMIRKAAFIAVVDIDQSESGKFKGEIIYPYGEKANRPGGFSRRTSARTITSIKGSVPSTFFIYDRSGRWDVLFQQGPGRYIVFLRGDRPFLTGVNGWFSSRLIKDDQVEWAEFASPSQFKKVSLGAIIAQIKDSADDR